jgi:hypothetical protein
VAHRQTDLRLTQETVASEQISSPRCDTALPLALVVTAVAVTVALTGEPRVRPRLRIAVAAGRPATVGAVPATAGVCSLLDCCCCLRRFAAATR